MKFLRLLYASHVLVNLTFGLVIVAGIIAYNNLPRSRDPDINFNWVTIVTALPGAAAIEVEKRITDPIEDTISRTVKDLRFVSSTSRDGISSILVRFNQLSEAKFKERIADLRREVQNTYTDQLPEEALDPEIRAINSSSGFPTAVVALTGPMTDSNFRRYTNTLKKEIERIKGVDEALLLGTEDPELHIAFYPERLEGLGIGPADLAATVSTYYRDVSIGDIETSEGRWLVRLEGTSGSLERLEAFPVVSANGVVELGSLADIYHTTAEPKTLAQFQGNPAVMISINRQEGINTLDLLEDLKQFLDEQNRTIEPLGYRLVLIDDQTVSTREAIGRMQQNALIGLVLVIGISFLFLGGRISFLTSIGIPFTLAATFVFLYWIDMSLNNSVLLGIVIALGMLVDDAVVVVETIYYRLQRGATAMEAAIESIKEVAAPVFTSVMTTVAAFLPLMLLPGIAGEFMRVIPLVVCIALLLSMLEAFWMLPAHIVAMRMDFTQESRWQRFRRLTTSWVRHRYSLMLVQAMRRPMRTVLTILATALLAAGLMLSGVIKFNFFAADPYRLLYVNAELPAGKSLSDTLAVLGQLEQKALAALEPKELRASISYSGQMFNQTGLVYGENFGQIFISLHPNDSDMRDTYTLIDAIEQAVGTRLGDAKVSLSVLEDGPPVGQPINVKVRGKRYEDIQPVTDKLVAFLERHGQYKNISTDFKLGNPELKLALHGDAIKRAGLAPEEVTSTLQSYVDGMLINQYQYLGEEVDVRLITKKTINHLDELLAQTLASPNGRAVALSELVEAEYGYGYQSILHHNFLRSITISADIRTEQLDTFTANRLIDDYWQSIKHTHPGVQIDYSGEFDDIKESLDGMAILFAAGVGLIYLILGTQFNSYSQPLLIMIALPLAFMGVVFGVTLTGDPVSLNTLYGTVALSGISVNSAIVLVSAANARIESGMSPLHATIYAGRRRVIPIIITSTTTIAGLFSLALGVGGKSLVWGPVATAIVSGLLFSTILVLIVVPLLYYASVTVHPWQWLKAKFLRRQRVP